MVCDESIRCSAENCLLHPYLHRSIPNLIFPPFKNPFLWYIKSFFAFCLWKKKLLSFVNFVLFDFLYIYICLFLV